MFNNLKEFTIRNLRTIIIHIPIITLSIIILIGFISGISTRDYTGFDKAADLVKWFVSSILDVFHS